MFTTLSPCKASILRCANTSRKHTRQALDVECCRICGRKAMALGIGTGHILLMTERPRFDKLSAALGSEMLEHLLWGICYHLWCIICALPTQNWPYCCVSHVRYSFHPQRSDWLFCGVMGKINLIRARGDGRVHATTFIWPWNGFLYFISGVFGQSSHACLDLRLFSRCCDGSAQPNELILGGRLW